MGDRIQALIDQGYHFNVGDYISKGLQYYRNNFGPITILIGISSLIPVLLNLIGVTSIVGLLNLLLITPFVTGAMAIFLRKASNEEHPTLETFGAARDHMKNLIIYNVLYSLVLLLCFIPFFIFAAQGGAFNMMLSAIENPTFLVSMLVGYMGGGIVIVMLLCMIPFVYLAVAYWWTPYLIVYKGMDPWPAMEASRKLVSKKWGNHFSLAFLIGLIAILLGLFSYIFTFSSYLSILVELAIGVIVGAFFSCALFAAYENIVGFEDDPEGYDPIDHLVS